MGRELLANSRIRIVTASPDRSTASQPRQLKHERLKPAKESRGGLRGRASVRRACKGSARWRVCRGRDSSWPAGDVAAPGSDTMRT
jgi:hypothetical protein